VDDYIRALSKFFRKTTLSSITPGMLKSYQMARQANAIIVNDTERWPWRRTAGYSRINHEINFLKQMLQACKEWDKTKEYYSPLPINGWSPREILSEKEEEELFKKVAGYGLNHPASFGRVPNTGSGNRPLLDPAAFVGTLISRKLTECHFDADESRNVPRV